MLEKGGQSHPHHGGSHLSSRLLSARHVQARLQYQKEKGLTGRDDFRFYPKIFEQKASVHSSLIWKKKRQHGDNALMHVVGVSPSLIYIGTASNDNGEGTLNPVLQVAIQRTKTHAIIEQLNAQPNWKPQESLHEGNSLCGPLHTSCSGQQASFQFARQKVSLLSIFCLQHLFLSVDTKHVDSLTMATTSANDSDYGGGRLGACALVCVVSSSDLVCEAGLHIWYMAPPAKQPGLVYAQAEAQHTALFLFYTIFPLAPFL